MTATRPDPRLGTDLGPYRIEAVIGRGGMGVVYRAEEHRLKRRVALKILPPGLADDTDYRARFERESQMAAAIDDPNILPVYEAGEIEGVLFIAMRYVEGTDLEARLRQGPMDPREAIRLLAQVASALDAAHLRGLVHRDVKPANILVAQGEDERGDHVYLTDFGLTKLRTEDTSLTRAGTIMGTLDYMAPEQLEGREIDGAVDQYALAAIAHRALTGQLPYERDSEAALITAILRDPPRSAVQARPELPPAVDAVLARGMAKAPVDRFATCATLISELRSALGVTSSLTVDARPTLTRDRRVIAAAVGALGLVLVALVGLGFVLGSGSPPATVPSPAVGAGSSASVSPDPSAYPNADEAALLALLPADVALRCRRGSYDNVLADSGASSRPLASLECTLAGRGFEGTTPDRVTALRLRDSTLVTADRVVRRSVKDHGVPDGDCAAEELPATGTWAPEGPDVGRVACWIEGGDAVVEWSHDRDRLVFRVARANRDEGGVIGLWQSIGFAVWAAIREADGGVDPNAYPNADEQAVIAVLPPNLREVCTRGGGRTDTARSGWEGRVPTVIQGDPPVPGGFVSIQPPTPKVSLSCTPASGASAVYVQTFRPEGGTTDPGSIADTSVSYLAGRYKLPEGDCTTAVAASGRWSNGGSSLPNGLVACLPSSSFDGHAWIYWTFDRGRVLAFATRGDADYDALYSWWKNLTIFLE